MTLNASEILAVIVDLHGNNAKLYDALQKANATITQQSKTILSLTDELDKARGPELPLSGAGGGNGGDKVIAVEGRGGGNGFRNNGGPLQ